MSSGLTAEQLADMLVAQIEGRIGSVEDASLTSLHLALADQILLLLRAGVPGEHVDPLLHLVWDKLRLAWARAADLPEQTHRNGSGYVC